MTSWCHFYAFTFPGCCKAELSNSFRNVSQSAVLYLTFDWMVTTVCCWPLDELLQSTPALLHLSRTLLAGPTVALHLPPASLQLAALPALLLQPVLQLCTDEKHHRAQRSRGDNTCHWRKKKNIARLFSAALLAMTLYRDFLFSLLNKYSDWRLDCKVSNLCFHLFSYRYH